MVNNNMSKRARQMSSMSQYNQGGGVKKTGFPDQVGKTHWMQLFAPSCNPALKGSVQCCNKNMFNGLKKIKKINITYGNNSFKYYNYIGNETTGTVPVGEYTTETICQAFNDNFAQNYHFKKDNYPNRYYVSLEYNFLTDRFYFNFLSFVDAMANDYDLYNNTVNIINSDSNQTYIKNGSILTTLGFENKEYSDGSGDGNSTNTATVFAENPPIYIDMYSDSFA